MAMLLTLAIPLTIAIRITQYGYMLAMAAGGAGGVGLTAPGHAYYGYTMGMLLQRPVLTMSSLTMAAGGAGGVGLPDGTAAAASG